MGRNHVLRRNAELEFDVLRLTTFNNLLELHGIPRLYHEVTFFFS
jgi:hypothetical protein